MMENSKLVIALAIFLVASIIHSGQTAAVFDITCAVVFCPDGTICEENPTRCTPLPTLPRKDGSCPVVPPGTIGTCVELCTIDCDCPDKQKCCSNGCGHVCKDPVAPFNGASGSCFMKK